MPELERALAETLREHAAAGPSDAGLLAAVHRRSGRLRRRTQALAATGGLLAAAAVGAGVLVVPWRSAPALPSGGGPTVTVSSPAPSTSSAVHSSLRFADGALTVPPIPLGLEPAVAGGWDPPVVEIRDGAVQATYFPHDPDGDADVVLRRTASKPAAPEGATRSPVTVRGVAGWLYVVPGRLRKLVVVWPEGGAWLSLRTDDTYTTAQVRRFVDRLTAQRLAPPPPVRFGQVPVGLAPTRVTQSEVDFGGRVRIEVTGPQVTVTGGVQRSEGTARLVVGFADDDRRLQVTVTPGIAVTDEDLLVFGAGLRLTEDADAGS